MEALLHDIAHYVGLAVEGIAILVIAIGSVEALINIFRIMSTSDATGVQKRSREHTRAPAHRQLERDVRADLSGIQ